MPPLRPSVTSIQPVLMFSISPPCALNARFPAAANCDVAIKEPSTSAIWKTGTEHSAGQDLACECHQRPCACHLLLECPWQQRPPISSRPPSSAIGPVARSVPAPCWSLAPTYFLSRWETASSCSYQSRSRAWQVHCAPPSPESARTPNLLVAPF